MNSYEMLSWFDAVNWQQGEWVPEIVVALWGSPKRFLDLWKEIRESSTQHRWSSKTQPVTKQSLSQTLTRMERDELLLRNEEKSSVPKAVWYELSPIFREFLEKQARPPAEWIASHKEVIDRVRQRRVKNRTTINCLSENQYVRHGS
jgi:DNA-binding HxlR family transcriptional regulator